MPLDETEVSEITGVSGLDLSEPGSNAIRYSLIFSEFENDTIGRMQLKTKCRTKAKLIRYALGVLHAVIESDEGPDTGWRLCWVKNGKARVIQIPHWR